MFGSWRSFYLNPINSNEHPSKLICNDKVHCLTAKSADRPFTEVRTMKQKNKDSKIVIKIKNLKNENKR